jgi:large subunit ribosomal protein L19
MAITATHKDTSFGVGDKVKVLQRIKEGEKERTQSFEGMVIGIKGRGNGKTFTVRRIGVQNVGIERIFPLGSPHIEKVEIERKGQEGSRRAKLYFTRDKSRKEVDAIYMRAQKKELQKKASKKK